MSNIIKTAISKTYRAVDATIVDYQDGLITVAELGERSSNHAAELRRLFQAQDEYEAIKKECGGV